MADTKPRPRASSAASRHARPPKVFTPRSAHTSDEFVHDFLNPAFDPAAFLNAKLPTLGKAAPQVPLADVSQQANALLSQLNAQTNRLSSTLTQLTDDILRSGSRLAYEVELLRGETLSLNETLHETLQEDVEKFVPEGLGGRDGEEGREDKEEGDKEEKQAEAKGEEPKTTNADQPDAKSEPSYVQQLRTLTLVRQRIETVVKTFGDAMDFGFPPSEVSVSSSFLSVSAPEPGSDQQSSEDKGQQVLKKLREEISGMLKEGDPVTGIERAANRIEELKTLTEVWKGTAEEKGRGKFIESLAKMVEDRHKELMREVDQRTSPSKKDPVRTGSPAEEARATPPPGGFGLISQLHKLRSGL